ncbi:MAG: hypothetical protein KF797_14180 [Flavobacteriales bacterium]|nr:hypothetical protein [Flavobacteriales bacterium]
MLRSRSIGGVLLFTSMASCVAQPPECLTDHRLLGDASLLAARGAYPEAFAAWDKTLPHCHYALWYRIEATEVALEHGDTARAIGYLRGVYASGGAPLLTYSDPIKGLLARGFHEPDLSDLRSAKEEWAAKADSTWIKALLEMKELDQSHRAFDAITRHNDSLNLERLISLTEQRGFPAPALTGSSYGIVNLLLWHHRYELGENQRLRYYVELARKAMDACLIEPDFLTGLIDFDAWDEKKPMPYGTLIHYFRNSLDEVRLPDLKTLNANRASVGMGPIEDFARMMDIPLETLPIGR